MSRARILAVGVLCAAAGVWLWTSLRPSLSPEELFAQALDSINGGRSDGVEAALERLDSDKEYWRHLAVLDALLFLRSGRPEEALQRLSTIPERTPVRELALQYGGEALYKLQRLGEAQQVFQMLKSEYPENVDARRWLGVIFYDLGAYDAAISELQYVASAVPDDYRPHHLLGIMYQDFEADEDAISCFRKALELNPSPEKKTQILADLSRVLSSNREYDQAIQILESLPDSALTNELFAQSFWGQGNITEAQQKLERAEQLGTLSADGIQLKAELEQARGNDALSISILERLVEDFPDRTDSRYQLALALQQSGRKEEGAQQMERWKEQRKIADELIQLNLKAVMDPNDADVRDRLSLLCRQLGKTQLADMWRDAAEACRRVQSFTEPQKSTYSE
ncbi:MAG TPA: tetratricopeptide repeat protein [Planctomycetes bacterium]|nr:tetratricopeptide repeat protein [Fuerstiella sp.]HIK90877.1 tetratricopeptide repeat protein [Planctomycetota bacterium]